MYPSLQKAQCPLTEPLHWCATGLALTLYRYKPELFPPSGGFNVNSPFNVRCLNSSNIMTS